VSKRAARRAEKRRRQEEARRRKASSSAGGKAGTPAAAAKQYAPLSTTPELVSPAQDLARIDFGRLSGLNKPAATRENYLESNRALANLSKTKNMQKMLADAEAKRQKLEQLKRGSEEDKKKAEQMQWVDMFKEADGTRVKDDPAKLKKALKRKAAKKAKSQKAWKARLEQASDKMAERQQIRQHNLSARRKGGRAGANLSKERISNEDEPGDSSGRRLSRAGFEGRKQDFLNSPKEQ
jgi:DNA excision repair protein ERCC-4